ncbi:DUF429 domain-containing protein [Paragemmobacter straminiformis]|uniref:DUF429 domain-containing protein n=1 Tax=Paragemmobacter straminiformis TaxID=2045119 RepID=A0A842I3G4_9RHOB|nr:DUF429 domain-containing protein [Gemmobacter straminiformis]MBC2834075.1 DUF429 domain-containing protein [Gemmobacter straminiformis]
MAGRLGLIAHCDWSVERKKRWMAVATRSGDHWRIFPPEPVGTTHDLFERLARSSTDGQPIFVGFDFPIGLPVAYGQKVDIADYRSLLGLLGEGKWAKWFDVCEHPHEITQHRPFYPMRPGGTELRHLLEGLGASSATDLLRQCDRRTASRGDACSVFWTLGGNQVGKAAISGWRELLRTSGQVALWPFDGRLDSLLGHKPVVVAETYPGDAYGQLGIPRAPLWSKRKPEGRAHAGRHLRAVIDRRGHEADENLTRAISAGFSANGVGEDQFDAIVGLLAMIEVADGHREDGCPYDDDTVRWEGWILGHSRTTVPSEIRRSLPKKAAHNEPKMVELGNFNDQAQQLVALVAIAGLDSSQQLAVMRCKHCMNRYGADPVLFDLQRCPTCGGGDPGLPLHILQLLPVP